jgi:hypothetical protein
MEGGSLTSTGKRFDPQMTQMNPACWIAICKKLDFLIFFILSASICVIWGGMISLLSTLLAQHHHEQRPAPHRSRLT